MVSMFNGSIWFFFFKVILMFALECSKIRITVTVRSFILFLSYKNSAYRPTAGEAADLTFSEQWYINPLNPLYCHVISLDYKVKESSDFVGGSL